MLLGECERGFIATHHTHKGNPTDAAQLVGAVTEVIAVTGRSPGTVAGDRGFGTAATDAALAELGAARIGLARTGTPGKARRVWEQTRRFRRMRNWRVGIEARASASSSAPSACGAPGYGACTAPAPGLAWGSLSTTCSA